MSKLTPISHITYRQTDCDVHDVHVSYRTKIKDQILPQNLPSVAVSVYV